MCREIARIEHEIPLLEKDKGKLLKTRDAKILELIRTRLGDAFVDSVGGGIKGITCEDHLSNYYEAIIAEKKHLLSVLRQSHFVELEKALSTNNAANLSIIAITIDCHIPVCLSGCSTIQVETAEKIKREVILF